MTRMYEVEFKVYNMGGCYYTKIVEFEVFPTEQEIQLEAKIVRDYCKYGTIEIKVRKFWKIKSEV